MPLLTRLLQGQGRDDQIVTHPHIDKHAHQVIEWARQFDRPILVPVGPAAERLLGAVEVLARGEVETAGWSMDFRERQALLVGTVAMSLIEFEDAAAILRRRGAGGVHGCAFDVSQDAQPVGLDSFIRLGSRSVSVPRSA